MSQLKFLKKDIIRLLGKKKSRILTLFFSRSFTGIFWYRVDRSLFLLLGNNYKFLRIILTPFFYIVQAFSNVDIHYSASIGPGILILHPSTGIVVSGQATIGENLTLTGGNIIGMSLKKGPFSIGHNCTLGANACIIGPLTLQNNITVGAMACVIKSYAEDNLILVGVPANPIKVILQNANKMKMLLTGAYGFLGKEIFKRISKTMEIISLGRNAAADIQCNLSSEIPTIPSIELVVHAAAKAHIVPKNKIEKQSFYDVNVQGTQNLLKGLENNKAIKKFVFISSVAVYGLIEGTLINEEAPLLAVDSYGKSKIEAEKLVVNWCINKNIDYYILRLPLLAGKNAPGNLGAMIKAIKSGKYFSIGNAEAKKSVTLSSDVAELIATINGSPGIYNLTDGHHPTFAELEKHISKFYKKKYPFSIPFYVAKTFALAGNLMGRMAPLNTIKLKKITSTLTFDDSKARRLLQWKSTPVLTHWQPE